MGNTCDEGVFGYPPIIHIILRWFRSFQLVRRTGYLAPEGIQVSASVVGGRLTTVFQPNPDLPFEEQLEYLQQGLLTIQERIAQAEAQMDREFHSVQGELVGKVRELKHSDDEILRKIEATSTGDIPIAAIGALWLFIGVILSTAAPEISWLLR